MKSIQDKVNRTLAVIDGHSDHADKIFPMVYDELRATAHELMQDERTGHTLAPTALVHEAYLRLSAINRTWESRVHFMNAAARAMRRILVDHARNRSSFKRGRGWKRIKIEDIESALTLEDFDWMAIDEAMQRFRKVDARAHDIVMLRFFAGRSEEEVADLLKLSKRQVRRDWKTACLWLRREMDDA
ncbi:MAG TPA: ECF-type sigma factor [Tepidisphaeraceae bacterium]|jgi:RNA polymerase sigma factor (TIGR02999 family)|nr:ECF-type sigma factor [Tepidisphaeraceae bacterium]